MVYSAAASILPKGSKVYIGMKERITDASNAVGQREALKWIEGVMRGGYANHNQAFNTAKQMIFEAKNAMSDEDRHSMVQELEQVRDSIEYAKETSFASVYGDSPELFSWASSSMEKMSGQMQGDAAPALQGKILFQIMQEAGNASNGGKNQEAYNKVFNKGLLDNKDKLSSEYVSALAPSFAARAERLEDISMTEGFNPTKEWLNHLPEAEGPVARNEAVHNLLKAYSEKVSSDPQGASANLKKGLAKLDDEGLSYFRSIMEEKHAMKTFDLGSLAKFIMPLIIGGLFGKAALGNGMLGGLMAAGLHLVGAMEDKKVPPRQDAA